MYGLAALFSPAYPRYIVALLQQRHYRAGRFLAAFWRTNSLASTAQAEPYARTAATRHLEWLVWCLIAVEVAAGVSIIAGAAISHSADVWPFGAALIIGYPVVVAHVVAAGVGLRAILGFVFNPKRAGKDLLCGLLEGQVRRLRRKNNFTVVAVVGSIGKTSTKLAIAHTLAESKRVIYQDGNYNDRLTVPLVLFGQTLPNLINLGAWLRILRANERIIRRPFLYDVAVLELGTDAPGQIARFAYLQPEVTIVTAITPEHMEFFKTMDAVAAEELTVRKFSKRTIINADDTPSKYLKPGKDKTYGCSQKADYQISAVTPNALDGVTLKLKLGKKSVKLTSPLLGVAGAKISAAAAATAHELGMDAATIGAAIAALPATPGRMQILRGADGSTIIDDTYNASPAAVIAGLDVLAAAAASRRIAILGSMNELGDYSPAAHEEVGAYCQPTNLDLVVTIGNDAKKYLVPLAQKNGCRVKVFSDPYAAGAFVRSELTKGAIVLGEGSQNGVFAEEAIKQLLENPADTSHLVRQSAAWLKIKNRQFKPTA